MDEEIKEILDYISDRIIPNEKRNKVRDYITNLQHENEELKKYLKTMEKGKDNNLNRFLNYKSRCEKAVELLKRYTDNESNYYVPVFELIDILNGRSDE